MRKFSMISAIALLAACNSTEEAPADEEAPAVDLASLSGAALITLADGSKILSYSTTDGVTYGGPLEGAEPAAWSTEESKGCIDPPGDEAKFCFTYGAISADGKIPVTDDAGESGTMQPLGTTYEAGTTPPIEAGSALVTFADGSTGLSVWTANGKAYLARNPEQGTWRAVDGKRCGKAPGAEVETCGTPGEPAADGSFVATPDEGDPVTVMPLA